MRNGDEPNPTEITVDTDHGPVRSIVTVDPLGRVTLTVLEVPSGDHPDDAGRDGDPE